MGKQLGRISGRDQAFGLGIMSYAIYKVELCWYLKDTSSCNLVPLLVVGDDADDAIANAKAELREHPKTYQLDDSKPIKAISAEKLDYFMYPKLIKRRKT